MAESVWAAGQFLTILSQPTLSFFVFFGLRETNGELDMLKTTDEP